jgi:hypothetical protein
MEMFAEHSRVKNGYANDFCILNNWENFQKRAMKPRSFEIFEKFQKFLGGKRERKIDL